MPPHVDIVIYLGAGACTTKAIESIQRQIIAKCAEVVRFHLEFEVHWVFFWAHLEEAYVESWL